MRRLVRNASRDTRFLESIAKGFFFEWLTFVAADKSQLANRSSVERSL
jgi:hypothetical protein